MLLFFPTFQTMTAVTTHPKFVSGKKIYVLTNSNKQLRYKNEFTFMNFCFKYFVFELAKVSDIKHIFS